jgi:asparagine synthase (glutamine-hydrolysing)
MCAIAGIVNRDGSPVDLDLLRRMAEVQRHRGPDGGGIVALCARTGSFERPGTDAPAGAADLRADVALAHRRLAVLDLEGGDQPLSSEDGTIWVTFNGEIYNFRALREELTRLGHAFRTRTDTEVIVHLYEEEGPALVGRLRGMFAFALWDARRSRLLLARDRLGKKPLYYRSGPRSFVFASELKALLLHPDVERRVDLGSLRDYLAFQYVPAPSCIFESVRKLPAAHALLVDGARESLWEYWDLPAPSRRGPGEEEAARELLRRLAEAVELRLASDVPLGAFLSGGIDSSTVVALMSRASAGRVKTFSVAFGGRPALEVEAAREVARSFGTDHEEIRIERGDLASLEEAAGQYDEPFADTSLLPQYLIARAARRAVTVCLTGDGGDELAAGYAKYRWGLPYRPADFLPERLKARLLRALGEAVPPTRRGRFRWRSLWLDPEGRYAESTAIFPPETQRALLDPGAWSRASDHDPWDHLRARLRRAEGRGTLDRILYVDRKLYLADDILVKVDRGSMLASLEVRCPFLDQEVVEFLSGLPAEMLRRRGGGKRLLRRAVAGLLPPSVLRLPKAGFGLDLPSFLGRALGAYAREVLLGGTASARGWFLPSHVRLLVERHERGRKDLSGQLWTLILFELWCRRYLDRPAWERHAAA